MEARQEARAKALRLAIEYFRDRNVSDTDMELQADKYYNYITTGRLVSRRGY